MSETNCYTVRVESMPRELRLLAARITLEQVLWWHMGGRADLKPGFHAEREAKARDYAWRHCMQAMHSNGV